MAGYDDTASIERIRAAMRADPSLSQRAAILREVGEQNLRRLQIKMRKEDKALSGFQHPPEHEIRSLFGYTGKMVSRTGTLTEKREAHSWIEGEDRRGYWIAGDYQARVGHVLRIFWMDGEVVFVQNLTTQQETFGAPSAKRSSEIYLWIAIGLTFASGILPAIDIGLPDPAYVAIMVLAIVPSFGIFLRAMTTERRSMHAVLWRRWEERVQSSGNPDATSSA